MAKPPSNPHDAYFRSVADEPANAVGIIRPQLPPAIARRIDWTVMELQSGSFIDDDLNSRYSDLLFRTRLDGHTAFIYLLIEHQSTNDRLMAMRMLQYVVNIWKHYVDADPNTKTLPAVIPLVVHTGSDGGRWTATTEVSDLIDLAPADRLEFGPYLPSFRYLVDDLTRLDLDTLMSRDYTPVTRVMMVLQRIAPGNDRLDRDIMMLVRDLQAMVTTGVPGELGAAMTYVLRVSDITVDGLRPLMDRLGPRAEEEIVTTAERLEARGAAREQRRMLINQLTAKFGPLPDHAKHTIDTASSSQIDEWSIRVLTADTLGDVFR